MNCDNIVLREIIQITIQRTSAYILAWYFNGASANKIKRQLIGFY